MYASTDSGLPDFRFRMDAGGMVEPTRVVWSRCCMSRSTNSPRWSDLPSRYERDPDAVMAVVVCWHPRMWSIRRSFFPIYVEGAGACWWRSVSSQSIRRFCRSESSSRLPLESSMSSIACPCA